jgi:membrane fusion protein, multidrug efflux system
MKRKIIVTLAIVLPVVLIASLLMSNKEKMDSRLINDNISAYPVNVEKVTSIEYVRTLKLMGKTEASNDIELISETAGRVVKIMVNTGDRLNKNDIIAEIDRNTAEAEYKLAEVSYQKAKRDYERFNNLFEQGNLSESELENYKLNLVSTEAQFKLAAKQLDNKNITSPISGVLSAKYIQNGSTVAPGTAVANIIDISRLKVNVDVPSSEILNIKRGQKVIVSSELLPGKSFYGVINSSGIKANDASTYPIEIIIINPSGLLRAGMFVEVEFLFDRHETVNIIPKASVIGSMKAPEVFVVKNNVAVRTKITAGEILNDNLIVESGLEIGEQVVTQGQNNLSDQCNVEIMN